MDQGMEKEGQGSETLRMRAVRRQALSLGNVGYRMPARKGRESQVKEERGRD